MVIQWQHCERFRPKEDCAPKDKKDAFFDDLKVTLGVGENFIKFDEPDTEKAISTRIQDTLRVDSASAEITNVKGVVNLSPN